MAGAVAAIVASANSGSYPILLEDSYTRSYTVTGGTADASVSFWAFTGDLVSYAGGGGERPVYHARWLNGDSSYEGKFTFVSGEQPDSIVPAFGVWGNVSDPFNFAGVSYENGGYSTKSCVVDLTIRDSVNTNISATTRLTLTSTRQTP